MKKAEWLASLLALVFFLPSARGGVLPSLTDNLARVNKRLCGTIVDYTHHHGADRRIWSAALCERRDMFVYLPPGYDPTRQYPLMIWLHGFMQDENSFLNIYAVQFDRAIACGKLPPMIIAAPDGTVRGRASVLGASSFFINSNAGPYEDYLLQDVWEFLLQNYSIRPEPECHILAGVSMGGFASFNQALKHHDLFKVAIGIYPPLNLRWMDCNGRYMANFDPECWGWRQDVRRGREVIGRFYGIVTIRVRRLIDPLFGRGPDALGRLSSENPAELLEHNCIAPGDLEMYVAYGGKDQFNLDAQIESFLYLARARGLCVGVGYDPRGKHDTSTALRLLPGAIEWLSGILAAQECQLRTVP